MATAQGRRAATGYGKAMMQTTAATMRRRKPRGEYAKSEATRQAIIEAAFEVFAQSGYSSGSLREVAQRVEMSEAGLLHHFRNKSTLLQAVLTHRDNLSLKLVPVETDDGAVTLHGLVALAAHSAKTPGVVELYCKLSAEATTVGHPAHAYFANRYEWTRKTITEAFAKLARDNRLPEGIDPMWASITTIAVMDGLQVQWLLDRTVVDMATALDSVFCNFVIDFDVRATEQVLTANQSLVEATEPAGTETAV